MSRKLGFAALVFAALLAAAPALHAAARKAHIVVLGAARKMPYSKADDPAGAQPGETELKVRALVVDGALKEWTTDDAHDVTDRSFVVRRAIKLNDSLPAEAPATADKPVTSDNATTGAKPVASSRPKPARVPEHWVWQRGPWLLVDRVTGHVVALKLPDYDPGVSQVSWFRDYGAYCGVTASGKSLFAVVAQVEARKAVLAKKLSAFNPESHAEPVCGPAEWQRDPLKVTFHPTGKDAIGFEVVPGSAVLVEDAGDEAEK